MTFLTARRSPRDAKSTFRGVLSALWKQQKATHKGICLVTRAARGRLAPLGGLSVAKKWLLCQYLLFWSPEWSSGVTLQNHFRAHFGAPGRSQGTPGGAKSRFPCVLSSIWIKRNPAHSGFCLGPGSGGRSLAPQSGHSGHKKCVSGPVFIFLGPFRSFGWHMGKLDFLSF